MRGRTSMIRCALAILPLLALSPTVKPIALTITKDARVQELAPDPDHCNGDGQPYQGVYCMDNHSPGGPTGCFLSNCEAHAVGAYHCFRIDSCK